MEVREGNWWGREVEVEGRVSGGKREGPSVRIENMEGKVDFE